VQNEASLRGPPPKRRILIIDDHPLVRRGLTSLIEIEPDLTVCAEAATQQTGFDAIASSDPDLVIADLSLEDGNGLTLVRNIRLDHEDLPVLVLTVHDAPVWAKRAFQAGASGYVTKEEMSETLLVAIRRVLGGEKFVSEKTRAGLDAT